MADFSRRRSTRNRHGGNVPAGPMGRLFDVGQREPHADELKDRKSMLYASATLLERRATLADDGEGGVIISAEFARLLAGELRRVYHQEFGRGS